MPRMPQVRARELVRFLKSQGFIEDRQSGPLDPLARGAEDLRHHSDAHRSRYRAGTCGPDSQGRWLLGRGLSAIAMRTPSPEAGLVYQLKITLLEIEPFIWRRLRVSASQTLEGFHTVLQK